MLGTDGFVEETGRQRGGRGRPATTYRVGRSARLKPRSFATEGSLYQSHGKL
ncbi:hypothetical protein [Yimella lutea]|uniref:hypothetical protein n=1 Tax=Yimella lutea TaxID=587872 RepID=UPI003CCC5308